MARGAVQCTMNQLRGFFPSTRRCQVDNVNHKSLGSVNICSIRWTTTFVKEGSSLTHTPAVVLLPFSCRSTVLSRISWTGLLHMSHLSLQYCLLHQPALLTGCAIRPITRRASLDPHTSSLYTTLTACRLAPRQPTPCTEPDAAWSRHECECSTVWWCYRIEEPQRRSPRCCKYLRLQIIGQQ